MTHTLNRTGLALDTICKEYIFLCMIPASQKGQKTEEMAVICDILLKHHPLNMIGLPAGLDEAGLINMARRATILTAVFNDREAIEAVVADIKEKNLGISVVLSGLFDEIHAICRNTDNCAHTHNISLGTFGKTDLLPDEKVLEITTQCGHALISSHYVTHIANRIKKGKMTCEAGMKLLVKPCVCGIANPERIQRALEAIVTP